jgi:hypothetical protein
MRASHHISANLPLRRYAYPIEVATALANSHQRNMALAVAAQQAANSSPVVVSSSPSSTGMANGLIAVQAGNVPTSVAVSLGNTVTLTPSITINALAAAAQAAAAAHQQHQAVSPNLHGLSP